jgi:hypothetical protein
MDRDHGCDAGTDHSRARRRRVPGHHEGFEFNVERPVALSAAPRPGILRRIWPPDGRHVANQPFLRPPAIFVTPTPSAT